MEKATAGMTPGWPEKTDAARVSPARDLAADAGDLVADRAERGARKDPRRDTAPDNSRRGTARKRADTGPLKIRGDAARYREGRREERWEDKSGAHFDASPVDVPVRGHVTTFGIGDEQEFSTG